MKLTLNKEITKDLSNHKSRIKPLRQIPHRADIEALAQWLDNKIENLKSNS